MDDIDKSQQGNNLEEDIEQVFRETPGTLPHPRDNYFDKIWTTIESKAPVGEKYYLRSIFIFIFGILFAVVFVLFYSDFLSSMVTLKEIRKENANFFTASAPLFAGRISAEKGIKNMVLTAGVHLDAVEDSDIRLESRTPGAKHVHFTSGHAIIYKRSDAEQLVIKLPDAVLSMKEPGSACNIFCLDRMIRIVPLTFPVQVKFKNKTETVNPGSTFYLLDGHAVHGPVLFSKEGMKHPGEEPE